MYRLWLALVSTVLGGAMAGCVSGSVRPLASLVISCCMTVQLYNPAFGPSAIPAAGLYASTVLATFIAAYFGHTLQLTLLGFKDFDERHLDRQSQQVYRPNRR
jgi:hypothetical protein